MLHKFNRIPGGMVLGLVVLALMGLGLTGCSENSPTQAPAGGNDSATGVFHVDLGDTPADFEFVSTKNGDPENPIHGPFAIRGRNIRYDVENNALVMDLSVKNLGENTFDEPVVLTFLSLLPESVTVLNPDNEENGPGAAVAFEFENDDNMWTPGEESFGREVQFGVDQGVSIGFVARLDMGGDDVLGSVGGMVWNDENGDGIMDETESGVEGATVKLSTEGMDPMTMMSGEDGTYLFEELPAGFYSVAIEPMEGMMGTTSPMIYVVLVTEDGMVTSFMAANFGVMNSAATGIIKGKIWNDLNGDGNVNDDEPGLEGVTVNLAGDATATTMTKADGTYAFEGLSMGSYEVASVGPDGWVLTTPSPIQVILESDDAIFNEASFGWMEEIVVRLGTISGVVFNDLNNNQIQDDGEPGVEGLMVGLQGNAIASTTTDADGAYMFTDLDIGDYTVKSFGPDGWAPTTEDMVAVMIETAGQVVDDIHFGWIAVP